MKDTHVSFSHVVGLLLAALALFGTSGAGCAPPAAKAAEVEVVYYYLPG